MRYPVKLRTEKGYFFEVYVSKWLTMSHIGSFQVDTAELEITFFAENADRVIQIIQYDIDRDFATNRWCFMKRSMIQHEGWSRKKLAPNYAVLRCAP